MSDCQFPAQCGFPNCFCSGQHRFSLEFIMYYEPIEIEDYVYEMTPEELKEEIEMLDEQKKILEDMYYDH